MVIGQGPIVDEGLIRWPFFADNTGREEGGDGRSLGGNKGAKVEEPLLKMPF